MLAEAMEEGLDGNPWENTEDEARPDDDQQEDQNTPLNVVVFPKGGAIRNDPVMNWAYASLIANNNNPNGINGWRIITVRSKKDAINQLSKLSINNLILFSHGGYGTSSKIEFGRDVIRHPSDLEGLQAVRARNIVLFACFIANPNISIATQPGGSYGSSRTPYLEGRNIMAQLARLTNATVFGNQGYSYPDPTMWNNPGSIDFVIAGVDLTWPYVAPHRYILDGAGIWSSVTSGAIWTNENTLYLNNNGTFGTLNNSWRAEPRIAAMLAAAQGSERDTYFDPIAGGFQKFRSGDGGNIVPAGGGTIR